MPYYSEILRRELELLSRSILLGKADGHAGTRYGEKKYPRQVVKPDGGTALEAWSHGSSNPGRCSLERRVGHAAIGTRIFLPGVCRGLLKGEGR